MAEEEGETFLDLLHNELKTQKAKLPQSELAKLEEALSIYDEVMAVIAPNNYLLDEDMTIAERIVDFVKEKNQSNLDETKTELLVDPKDIYRSLVTLIMITVYGESLQADDEVYKELLKETDMATIEQQRAFLLYTLIPIYNAHVEAMDLTKTEARVSNALGNPLNPRYNAGVSRYLKEKYGKKFYITYWKLLLKQIDDFDLNRSSIEEILTRLRKIVELEEAENYTPGTLAYKETIDSIARRTGKLTKDCDALDYDEFITLAKMYLSTSSLLTLCTLVNYFRDRLDLEQPCEEYSMNDILDVLTQLVDILPKTELCQVLRLLNKPITIPIFEGKKIKDIVKIWRQVSIESVIKQLPEASRHLIFELTRKDLDYTKLIEDDTGVHLLTRSGSQVSIILEGSISLRVTYLNEWVYDIILNAGDIIETNFPSKMYIDNEVIAEISQVSVTSRPVKIFYAVLGDRTLSNIPPRPP